MRHSVSKTLLSLAALGAFASNNANASDCGSTTASNGALTVNQTECISGNGLYYYVDVESNNTALEIQTSGGTGEADILVSPYSWATSSSYTQRTNNSGTEETLAVTANAGRLYVSIFGIHQGVTLAVKGDNDAGTDTGGGDTTPTPSMCGSNTLSGYELTLESQECISGNGQYFFIDVEADNTKLLIETKNGSGQADIYVNTGNWATRSDNIASAQKDGTNEALKITANAGRLYISIFGLNDEVSFKVSADNGTEPVDPDPIDPVSDVPTLPANPGLCGTETPVEGRLTFNQVECVNGSDYAMYVHADDIEITISTGGGTGEFDLLVSQQGWASPTSYDHKSSNVGTSESITFTANAGWLYVGLNAENQTFSDVSLLVAIDSADMPSTDGDGGGSTIPVDDYATDATRFIGLNGSDLVTRIALTHPQNVSPIYNISGADATQIYSEANMIAIANAINARAPSYTGDDTLDGKFDATNTSGLESLFYFLRGSFFVSFAHPDDVPVYSDAVKATIKTALRTFFNNSNAWKATDSNGGVLKEALINVDSADLGADFNDITIKVLNDYNADWKASFNMNAAANSVFTTLWRSQWNDEMKAIFTADDSILTALFNFQNTHRDLIGSNAEYVLQNAVNEMARLYHVDALFPRVKTLVKAVLDTTSKADETKALWIKAASMADYYDRADCGYYDICGFAYTLEQETLSFNYQCSDSLKIRAQDLYNDQAAWICEVLGNQESNFHAILGSGYQPVADDNNEALELVIFNSATDYQTYAGQFFGIATNNGGMYLEGAPINEKNQARFIAYEAAWMQPNFHVWNLQHEYVHYLDGRFDLYGGFQLGMTVNTVWWSEGLGEYISYGNGYERAIEVGQSQEFALSEIFKNDYNSGQTRVYQWGYLAVRFMFEKQKASVDHILSLTRTGKFTEYQEYMDNLGTSYDAEFTEWLVNGVVLGDNNIVEFGPNDIDSATAGNGTAGNWAGEPVTISTDFSPCVVDVAANKHDTDNNTFVGNQIVECINSSNGSASFFIRNEGNLATRYELTTTGGWGNADILFKADGWPSAQDNDGYANGDGNWDSLVFELNPDVYWHYISLDGEFGGVKLSITEQ